MFHKDKNNGLDYRAINNFFYTSNNLLKFVLVLIIILAVLLATFLNKRMENSWYNRYCSISNISCIYRLCYCLVA